MQLRLKPYSQAWANPNLLRLVFLLAAPACAGAGLREGFCGLSADDFERLDRGEAVGRVLPSQGEKAIGIFAAVKLRVPKEAVRDWYSDARNFKESKVVMEAGEFHRPPRPEDVAAYGLTSGDIEDARRCQPGDCGLKLAADAIQRLRRPPGRETEIAREGTPAQRNLFWSVELQRRLAGDHRGLGRPGRRLVHGECEPVARGSVGRSVAGMETETGGDVCSGLHSQRGPRDCAERGKTGAGGEVITMDETDVRRRVEDQLALEPSLDAAGIGVAVHSGIVTLTGRVKSAAEVQAAAEAALRVEGVRGLANELAVVLPGEHVRDDEAIALAALTALEWSTQVPAGAVKVRVAKGVVTLEGEVEWNYQRAAAARLIRELIGVTSVENRIRLKVEAAPASLKEQVEAALHKCRIQGPSHIRVETRGDHVMLWGTVANWRDRDEAERAAWCVRGVCHVDNHLATAARQTA